MDFSARPLDSQRDSNHGSQNIRDVLSETNERKFKVRLKVIPFLSHQKFHLVSQLAVFLVSSIEPVDLLTILGYLVRIRLVREWTCD